MSITIRSKIWSIAIFWVAQDDKGKICIECMHLNSIENGQPSETPVRWAKDLLLAPVSISICLLEFAKLGFAAQSWLEMLQEEFFLPELF